MCTDAAAYDSLGARTQHDGPTPMQVDAAQKGKGKGEKGKDEKGGMGTGKGECKHDDKGKGKGKGKYDDKGGMGKGKGKYQENALLQPLGAQACRLQEAPCRRGSEDSRCTAAAHVRIVGARVVGRFGWVPGAPGDVGVVHGGAKPAATRGEAARRRAAGRAAGHVHGSAAVRLRVDRLRE